MKTRRRGLIVAELLRVISRRNLKKRVKSKERVRSKVARINLEVVGRFEVKNKKRKRRNLKGTNAY